MGNETKEKWTEGPWRVAFNVIESGGYDIATIEDDGDRKAPASEQRTNAHLIAAAPNLAKAAEGAREVLEGLSVDPVAREELEHYWPRLAAIHQELSSALAKARGGE